MIAPSDELGMIRVLGPIDVVIATRAVTIGSRLERMILAILALSANHAVSSNQLAGILWGDHPPPSRDNTLQTYISRLRLTLGRERIATEASSYTLAVTPEELDALVFESRVAEAATTRGDPARCLLLCRSALALWRGAPFGAFTDEDPFRLEAIRLNELRLFGLELRIECEIELGNEAMVVGSLEALVEEYPYRERFWHLLIVAMSLCGRRVEALRACSSMRDVLGEVGLTPTNEFRQLEDTICSEDQTSQPRLHPILGRESQ